MLGGELSLHIALGRLIQFSDSQECQIDEQVSYVESSPKRCSHLVNSSLLSRENHGFKYFAEHPQVIQEKKTDQEDEKIEELMEQATQEFRDYIKTQDIHQPVDDSIFESPCQDSSTTKARALTRMIDGWASQRDSWSSRQEERLKLSHDKVQSIQGPKQVEIVKNLPKNKELAPPHDDVIVEAEVESLFGRIPLQTKPVKKLVENLSDDEDNYSNICKTTSYDTISLSDSRTINRTFFDIVGRKKEQEEKTEGPLSLFERKDRMKTGLTQRSDADTSSEIESRHGRSKQKRPLIQVLK